VAAEQQQQLVLQAFWLTAVVMQLWRIVWFDTHASCYATLALSSRCHIVFETRAWLGAWCHVHRVCVLLQGEIFAAEGYAKTTGRVGVCIATSGPGATNLVTGLADAMMDSVPLVAITGQVRRSSSSSSSTHRQQV
jgi:hypothetical protein